jgi:hypothetical protein
MNRFSTVIGLPSARISARPAAADNAPRVTMKSVIRPLAMIVPLSRPTAPDAATPASIANQMLSVPVYTSPSTTAPNVMTEAMDKSMPAVATTKVWPTASTTRMALACSIASMLPPDTKVGSSTPKTMIRTTRPIGAASSGQGAEASRLVRPAFSSTPWAAGETVDMIDQLPDSGFW